VELVASTGEATKTHALEAVVGQKLRTDTHLRAVGHCTGQAYSLELLTNLR